MNKIFFFIIFLFFLYLIYLRIKQYFFEKKIKKWDNAFNNYSHNLNNLGYRSDCSGFVSYMWNLDNNINKGGPRTRGKGKNNLIYWGEKIKKSELKKGDILLVPDRHVILFDKWLNNKYYYGYEVCNIPKCRGFKHQLIKYPYNKKIRPKFNNPILLRYKNN